MMSAQVRMLLKSVFVFGLAGASSLILGAWFVSMGGTATYRQALSDYARFALFATAVSALSLYGASLVLSRATTRFCLFCYQGRARTGWTAVIIAVLSAGVVGAATSGPDGFTIGMLVATISGFPAFALASGVLFGGDGEPSLSQEESASPPVESSGRDRVSRVPVPLYAVVAVAQQRWR